MKSRGAIAVVLWFALTVSFPAQSRDETFVIRGVRVFDGTTIIENQTVVIASGQIAAIGTTVTVPAGAIDVSGQGRTLLPGLIDSHVHVGIGSAVDALQQSLAFGVTTVLDMWTTPVFSKWKEIEKADRADLASIRGAGNGATVPGGHPTQMDGGADRGGIAPGLRADLLLVEGDPSREIRHTRRIVGVWKRGVRLAESSQP